MTAYYNEIDPYAAQWLRNLMEAGVIAPGHVDERDTHQHRRPAASGGRCDTGQRDAEPCGVLGHTGGAGLEVGQEPDVERRALRIEGTALGAAEPVCGFWRGADWIWCRDGKYRPVEPGTFPLAHGVAADLGSVRPGEGNPYRGEKAPWRVGMLRGYGNAINAETAAEFIGAYLDVQGGAP